MPDQLEHRSWSWRLPDDRSAPARALHEIRHDEPSFRRAVAFTIAGTAIPGLGLIAGRRRIIGSIILGLFAAAVLALGIYAAVDRQNLLGYALDPKTLRRAALALVIIALVWVAVIVASHLSLRGRPTPWPAGVSAASSSACSPLPWPRRWRLPRATPTSRRARSARCSRARTRRRARPGRRWRPLRPTPGEPKPQDPWAGKPRLNILLLGGDAGPGRVGTRTDTVILASINTKTGDTTLFSLPRNTARMPFPSRSPLHKYYPYGFTNGDGHNAEYFLNAMYDNVPRAVPKDVLGPTDNLGADVLKLSVGEATGLQVDYYVLINLEGFSKMINALGGITRQHQHLHPDRRQHRSAHPAEGVPQAGTESEAQRAQRAVVRARPLRLGRLRPDGPAALRDQRDHQAGQPDQHAGPLRGHREGRQAARLHRHAAGGPAAHGRSQPAGKGRQCSQRRVQVRS